MKAALQLQSVLAIPIYLHLVVTLFSILILLPFYFRVQFC